jgi:levansucrase
MTTAWTADHVLGIASDVRRAIPLVAPDDLPRLAADRVYWDMWPVQDPAGRPACAGPRALWMALSAPDRGDPALRHFEAKIHLLERRGDGWADLGPAMPDWSVPYEREWAGSALLKGDKLTLFFTAAGSAARSRGYQQELWEASAKLGADGLPYHWSEPKPSIIYHHPHYMLADVQEGEPGKIKAFRDPAWFCDPADGAEYLAFTASLAGPASAYNGAFGLARREATGWCLLPPPITADGVNNELERAHLVHHDGRYYAFWSTQTSTFAPGLSHAPNGLYGMVAESIAGPYRPLNGTGLVLANPAACPAQTYSWFVDATLTVCSFVDMVPNAGGGSARFVGVPAPFLRLDLSGDCARLCSDPVMASQ